MEFQENIILYMEILGAIAFAISGAMVGIRHSFDLFGVLVLGCCTAVGGGMCRDIILGQLPNFMINPTYFFVAAVTAFLVFTFLHINQDILRKHPLAQGIYEFTLLLSDSIGLGIFTVVGIIICMRAGYENHEFVLIFLGTLTAVGGGLLRDVIAGVTPFIFKRHIYAIASMIGGAVYLMLHGNIPEFTAIVLASGLVVAIRLMAAHYKWNLPRIKIK